MGSLQSENRVGSENGADAVSYRRDMRMFTTIGLVAAMGCSSKKEEPSRTSHIDRVTPQAAEPTADEKAKEVWATVGKEREAQLRAYSQEVKEAWQSNYPDGSCPVDLGDLTKHMTTKDTNDPWGRPYRISCKPDEQPRVLYLVSAGPDGTPKNGDDIIATIRAQPAPPIDVTARKLFADYQENEIAADTKYKGKLLRVSGKIAKIEKVLGDPVVEFRTSNEYMPVYATFKSEADLAALKRGQEITVICRGEEASLDHARVGACRIDTAAK